MLAPAEVPKTELTVELAFATEQLRKVCESPASARRSLGQHLANALIRRLADIRAASSVAELANLGFLTLPIAWSDELKIVLTPGQALVALANQRDSPVSKGYVDWSRVYRLKLLRIERTNV
ncbi:MAG: hypothetical protein KIT60_14330 [Burkholderiaceae bacterium]|nr:hypothetical protein [Burkholderiaceae bacterium]